MKKITIYIGGGCFVATLVAVGLYITGAKEKLFYTSYTSNKKTLSDIQSTPHDAAAEIEKRISDKYDEFIRNFPFPPDAHTKKYFQEQARLFVLDPEKYAAEQKRMHDEWYVKRKPKQFFSAAEVRSFLSPIKDKTPLLYVFCGFLAADASILKEGLAAFPGNTDLMYAIARFGDAYLDDPKKFSSLVEQNSRSFDLSLLGARAAMKAGDLESAKVYFANLVTSEEISPQSTYKDTWDFMRKTWNPEIEALPENHLFVFNETPDKLMFTVLNDAIRFYTENADVPGAEEIAHSALALAEKSAENVSVIRELFAVKQQLRLLNDLGPQTAQKFIDIPYGEFVNSLNSRMEDLTQKNNTLETFRENLSSHDKSQYNDLSKEIGEWNAYLRITNQ